MNVIKTAIDGVVIIEPRLFPDERGYFFESYEKKEFEAKVRPINFIQDNESRSSYGVLRGIHYQKGEHAQSKLVRCVVGRVLDVAVDLRKGSPTFGQHVAVELTEDKCDNYYCPESEGAIAWNDPALGIDWRIPADKVILSPKDLHHPLLKDSPYLFEYPLEY